MIATTLEQSKRLLEAGIEPESADFLYSHDVLEWRGEPQLFMLASWQIPAWSLSALWNILHNLDKTYEFDTKYSAEELIEVLVTVICRKFNDR